MADRFYREKPQRRFNWLDPFASYREERLVRADASLARQLQASMELNARTKNRLQALSARLKQEANPELVDVGDDLDEICQDQDPF